MCSKAEGHQFIWLSLHAHCLESYKYITFMEFLIWVIENFQQQKNGQLLSLAVF